MPFSSPWQYTLFCAVILGVFALEGCCTNHPTVDAKTVQKLAQNHQLPADKTVRVTGVVFHDWYYPHPEKIKEHQSSPKDFLPYTKLDKQGGSTWHGVAFRLDSTHDYSQSRNKSGPKMIAFFPYGKGNLENQLKKLYRSREPCELTVSPIGMLSGDVWNTPVQNEEEDMPAFVLHSIH